MRRTSGPAPVQRLRIRVHGPDADDPAQGRLRTAQWPTPPYVDGDVGAGVYRRVWYRCRGDGEGASRAPQRSAATPPAPGQGGLLRQQLNGVPHLARLRVCTTTPSPAARRDARPYFQNDCSLDSNLSDIIHICPQEGEIARPGSPRGDDCSAGAVQDLPGHPLAELSSFMGKAASGASGPAAPCRPAGRAPPGRSCALSCRPWGTLRQVEEGKAIPPQGLLGGGDLLRVRTAMSLHRGGCQVLLHLSSRAVASSAGSVPAKASGDGDLGAMRPSARR
jgi:hypothetical protein